MTDVPIHVRKAELFQNVSSAAPDSTIVCVLVPFGQIRGHDESTSTALVSRVTAIPRLSCYAQIGLYLYLGCTQASAAAVAAWARAFSRSAEPERAFRVGVARAGADGMASLRDLEAGIHEAIRADAEARVFTLDEATRRVVPRTPG